MNPEKPGDDRIACIVCSLNLSGLTMIKVILWLVAITIVSFVIGFGILAVSGTLHPDTGNSLSPFRHTAPFSPNTTTIPLDGATTGMIRITMGAGEVTVSGNAPAAMLMETTVYCKASECHPVVRSSINGTEKTVTMTKKDSEDGKWFPDHTPEQLEDSYQ